jgi:hypothetical protein
MDTEKINLTVLNDGKSQIEIRQGAALSLKEPKIIDIAGNIDSPSRLLTMRVDKLDQLACNIVVDRSPGKRYIKLTIDETNHYGGSITGKIIMNPDFVDFGINSGKKYTLRDLSDFIKMHRYCFEDPQVAMKLVTDLRNFKAKVNKDIEKLGDNRGNKNEVLNQVVDTNIPDSFTLNMPIFKGALTARFKVEINIIVRDADMDCTLESVEANDLIQVYCDNAIEAELNKIKEIAPQIVQIEL